MRAIKKRYIFFVLFVLLIGVFLSQVPIFSIYSLPEVITICSDDLNYINENDVFGKFITLSLKPQHIKTINDDNKQPIKSEVQFKLFNLIPIKKQTVKMLKPDGIFAGGMAVGLVLKTDGVLVVGSSAVETEDGSFEVCKEYDLKIGDTITYIDDKKIESTSTISSYLNSKDFDGESVVLKINRKGKEITTTIKPAYDLKTKTYKLGVWVRDDASGIGTLTFIDENNRFGALGHPICDSDTKTIINVKEGSVYNCSILGVNKGVSGNPGEIRGLFLQGKNKQGYIDKNNNFGVFGEIEQDSNLYERVEPIKIGGRLTVKPGRAQIKCCIDGNNTKMFDVEIVKTNYQNYSNDKSMVIRVVDKELLAKTGGIVQGMSGSPIIQDGRLIGAVTHVFINDPTKGYGVYLDWMLSE